MKYLITTQVDRNRSWELLEKLIDGTIKRQSFDGAEIAKGLESAKVINNTIQFYMICYCRIPLEHEKEIVFDIYFHDLEITPASEEKPLDGENFIEYLKKLT